MMGSGSTARRPIVTITLAVALAAVFTETARGQNFAGDARAIALGGMGGHENDAAQLAGDPRNYSAFSLPLGLFQVFKKRKIFDPGDPDFDPLRALELLASPVHFTFNREVSDPAERLVRDLVNGRVSRDLNSYRGFVPKAKMSAQGMVAPTWGKTIKFRRDKQSGSFQGIYLGVGPYVSVGNEVSIDQNLINILASSTNVNRPNSTFQILNFTEGQAAAAIIVGYRARISASSAPSASERDGVYVSANYRYLYGLHYDTANLNVRFDTDNAGLITLAPTTTPLVATHQWSENGRGLAIDLGTQVVKGRWDVRFAANGVGNRMNWKEFKSEQWVLGSLVQNLEFSERPVGAPVGTKRIELPVRFSGGGAYNADRYTVDAEILRGLQKTEFRAGGEFRWAVFDLRGGTRYIREQWQPAGGIGLNLGKRLGVDLALFGTATNIEKVRKTTMALSLRWNHARP